MVRANNKRFLVMSFFIIKIFVLRIYYINTDFKLNFINI
jgi:hypothetical protein